jgi:hypothetical protein
VIGQLWPEETPVELGLTTARQFQGAFGPMVLSIIVVALQTQGHASLVQILMLLSARADELEAARARGMWAGAKAAENFWAEKRPRLPEQMESLWMKFWEGIDRPVPQQK